MREKVPKHRKEDLVSRRGRTTTLLKSKLSNNSIYFGCDNDTLQLQRGRNIQGAADPICVMLSCTHNTGSIRWSGMAKSSSLNTWSHFGAKGV